MLPVQGDELAADALQLRERDGVVCGELDGFRDVGNGDFSSGFAGMVFLVGRQLREDVGCGFVELVEVVLFRRWFLRTRDEPVSQSVGF